MSEVGTGPPTGYGRPCLYTFLSRIAYHSPGTGALAKSIDSDALRLRYRLP